MKIETAIKGIVRLLLCIGIIFNLFNSLHAQYRVERLGGSFNTPGSETGAVRVGDTVLVYSTMERRETGNKQFSFDKAQMNLMQARIARGGKLSRPKPCRWGLNSKRDHTGNLCIDPVSGDLYFTHARRGDDKLRCEIWTARKLRRGWDNPVCLGGDINGTAYTSTHPAVGRLDDGSVVLYYASDRSDGMGGMDIWYTIVKDGNCGQSVNLGPQVNTSADELTPFYDQPNGVLYFSSDRPGGLGGYDVYCAVGQRNTWQQVEPTCGCLNSPWNDIYFTIAERDAATGMPVAGYLASNRPTAADSTACCNDLYQWSIDSTKFEIQDSVLADAATDTVTGNSELQTSNPELKFMFPLFLYFHNDEPDPRSTESTTTTTYTACQRRYAGMRNEYVARQQNADDSAMMQMFFDTCVEGNYHRVEALFDFIEEQLDEGRSCVLTVSGYASPLHHSDYNQTLSERRIASFVNMIREWRGGLLSDAIDDGRLTVVQRPRGIDKVTTDHRTPATNSDPVYGLSAAMARRIEITSCEVILHTSSTH